MLKKLIVLLSLGFALSAEAQEFYKEIYRPHYHLSPQWGWMGDPNGMIYFNGKYHLLWWGHAMSEDLVHWTQYNNFAMQGGPSGFGYWSGSVVVDADNTAGFNTAEDTAMVAVYTMHYDNGVEKVGISSSLNHVSFQYYEGNPVINVDQHDFRDPQVFWHEATNRWIMVIARAAGRAVEFYASADLKSWEYLSSFNAYGAKDQLWEVPDLFQLPLNDDPSDMKWVLTCGMGPNKVQFWVGDFDGNEFELDSLDNHYTGAHVTGEIFEDFEGQDFGDWIVTGDAFGTGPATGTLPNQQEVNGFSGKSFVNSYHNGDITTGKMVSPGFQIQKRHINFLVGGGIGSGLTIKLFVDGVAVASGTSLQNQETMRWDGWDVSQWIGQTGHIEIEDTFTGGWGHILIDQIVFSDVLYDSHIENASWADWGKDFYAARSYRNYSFNDKERSVWIGWMGNWTYAQNVPTVPWKGHQSLPRSIKLVKNDKGYQLLQYPLEEFQILREEHFNTGNTLVEGIVPIQGFKPEWNVFELKTSFKITSKDQVVGLYLAEADSVNKLVIGFDAAKSQLFIDRRKAGTYLFHSSFPSIFYAPVNLPADSVLDLHIFMDQSSVEVFANNYETVMSALVFTQPPATGISLFSENGAVTFNGLEAWKLKSIWGITPDQVFNDVPDQGNKTNGSLIYPNPFREGDQLAFNTLENIHIDKGSIRILDLCGREVFEQDVNNCNLSEIRLADFPAGLPKGQYLLHLQTSSIFLAEKLIHF